ncbi:MAG: transposase [Candidatus Woesebacteria bacterium]|nr:transposase [Candidatus Woesebacteria bacterium]
MANNRNVIFANNEIYHILNRSIAKEDIFIKENHLNRILNLIDFYRFPQSIKFSEFKKLSLEAKQLYIDSHKENSPLVEIYGFSIMPNHFHLLSKQLSDNGIFKFTSNIQNGYAKYFNKIMDRDGSLFKRPFRAKHIDNDDTFIHVLRYIHLNPVTAYLIEFKDLSNFQWNSFSHYLYQNKSTKSFVNTSFAIEMLGNVEKLIKFTADQEDHQKRLSYIKNISLE